MKDREHIYDEQINPLMGQIITICREQDIPFFASFQLTDGLDAEGTKTEEGSMYCTSTHLPEWADESLTMCLAMVRHGVVIAWLMFMRKAGVAPVPISPEKKV